MAVTASLVGKTSGQPIAAGGGDPMTGTEELERHDWVLELVDDSGQPIGAKVETGTRMPCGGDQTGAE